FFFFQAEDGIRDDLVTGVQTCALPIYFEIGRILHLKIEIRNLKLDCLSARQSNFRHPDLVRLFVANEEIRMSQRSPLLFQGGDRSEERRVGKERRVWWTQNI